MEKCNGKKSNGKVVMKMKILDKYILKKFIGTFFYTIIVFTAIAIIIDTTEKLDEFVDNKVPFHIIVTDYYINFIPYISSLLSPLFIFIAVIFFTSKMAYNAEIIAMLGNGVSFNRMLYPYLGGAALLTCLLLFSSHILVPAANQKRITFENTYIDNPYINMHHNIHMQISPESYIYLERFNNSDSAGYKFALEKIKDGQLYYKLRADKIQWNFKEKKWILTNYFIREFTGQGEKISAGNTLKGAYGFKPTDFHQKIEIKEMMTTPVLSEFIEREKKKGSDKIEFYEVEKYKRTSNSFAAFILTIIGVALASRKVRGGMGFHIALGIGISAAYIIFMQFTQTFSTNANLPPIIGVWIPNCIFGVLAIILLKRAPK